MTLAGLGAAGYRWSATVDDPTIVAVADAALASGADTRLPGASRDQAFSLLALSVGETKVRLVQARSFEPGGKPNAVREMHVRVVSAKAD